MKSISVIWTKYSDPLAELVYNLTERTYTHAAISLEDDQAYYYSFCFKGFCRETIEKYRRRGVKKSLRMRLEVPEDVYEGLQRKLDFMERNANFYRYTKFGVFCALLHLPIRRYRHYFCSQFVAELLESTGAIQLSRPSYLTLPNHLLRDLKGSSGFLEIAADVV